MSAAAARLSVPPTDPLGPVAQDPDAIRRAACKLVFPDVVCSPPAERTPPAPRTVDAGLWSQALQIMFWVIVIALTAGLVYMLARTVLRRHSPGRRRRRARDRSGDSVMEPEHLGLTIIDHRRQPSSWRDEADDHRRAGRFREALRCRYRALVGDLARRSAIDEIPGRTTGEERQQLSQTAPAGSVPFAFAADLFDAAWYGHLPVGDADVERMVAWETEVLTRVPVDAGHR